jgi:hypothetical protein
LFQLPLSPYLVPQNFRDQTHTISTSEWCHWNNVQVIWTVYGFLENFVFLAILYVFSSIKVFQVLANINSFSRVSQPYRDLMKNYCTVFISLWHEFSWDVKEHL